MKPKEKAEDLFSTFCIYPLRKEQAIYLCLKAVDEIIKSEKLDYLFTQNKINSIESTSDDRWIHETFIDYWHEVKHEIELL